MISAYHIAAVEIGGRPRHLQNTVIRPCGKRKLGKRRFHKRFGFAAHPAEAAYVGGRHQTVAKHCAAGALGGKLPCRDDPLAYGCARFRRLLACKLIVFQSRYLDMYNGEIIIYLI